MKTIPLPAGGDELPDGSEGQAKGARIAVAAALTLKPPLKRTIVTVTDVVQILKPPTPTMPVINSIETER